MRINKHRKNLADLMDFVHTQMLRPPVLQHLSMGALFGVEGCPFLLSIEIRKEKLQMKQKLISIFLIAAMAVLCACGGAGSQPQNTKQPQASDGKTKDSDKETKRTMKDPSRAEITIPEEINSIITLSPSFSEIVTALGLGDKITAYDIYSAGIEGLPSDAPTFDITNPDMEQLTALNPDVMLVTDESFFDQESPYKALIDAGTCVICIPNSMDIAGIKNNIKFLADALGASEAGETLLKEFNEQLEELADTAAEIPEEERKRVYFEIAPAPNMYSFGKGVFLNEMIEWIGAENILADQSDWLTVEGETIVKANPDFIFTNVNYTDDPVKEILSRDGWADISAIANGNVYLIDNNSSSQPTHNIIKAMRQMAEIIYPDYYTKAE